MNIKIRLQDLWRSLLRALGIKSYLCKSCIYNNPRDCRHRARPYATICEDYRRR